MPPTDFARGRHFQLHLSPCQQTGPRNQAKAPNLDIKAGESAKFEQ
jgi:hypothetical protein